MDTRQRCTTAFGRRCEHRVHRLPDVTGIRIYWDRQDITYHTDGDGKQSQGTWDLIATGTDGVDYTIGRFTLCDCTYSASVCQENCQQQDSDGEWHSTVVLLNTAMTGCEACAAGTYETNRQCADCAAGTFSGTSLQTACVDCPADTYQPGPARRRARRAPRGARTRRRGQ